MNFFSIQRIFFVLGGGFPGIYSFRLTDRCWSADGNGVILDTTWRSYKVGISYRLITFLFVNLAKICWFLQFTRLPLNRSKPQIIKKALFRNTETNCERQTWKIMEKCSQVNYSQKEFSDPRTGVEPMTFQIPVGRSNHCAVGDWWWARSYTRFLYVWQVSC